MKRKKKNIKPLKSKPIFRFKKNALSISCSGGTVDTTTITTTTGP